MIDELINKETIHAPGDPLHKANVGSSPVLKTTRTPFNIKRGWNDFTIDQFIIKWRPS